MPREELARVVWSSPAALACGAGRWLHRAAVSTFRPMNDSTSWKGKAAAFLGSQVLSLLGTSLVRYALM